MLNKFPNNLAIVKHIRFIEISIQFKREKVAGTTGGRFSRLVIPVSRLPAASATPLLWIGYILE